MSIDRDSRDAVGADEERAAEPRAVAPGKRMLTTSMAAVIARMGNGPAPGVTPELETALGESGSPLPDAARYSADVGADVSQARVVTGPSAAAAASSIGAAAFTLGERVFFGAGSYAPGTAGGDHILRHELTHVAQQAGSPVPAVDQLQFTAPGSAAESEAHQVAESGGAAPSAQPAQVARFDYEKLQEQQVGGNRYAFNNAKDLYFAFGTRFVQMPVASPSPYVTWSQGSAKFLEGFVHQMATIAHGDVNEWTEVARRVVQPEDFRELVNRGRVLFGTKTDDKTKEVYDAGPRRFQDASALPLVHAIHRRLLESLQRMMPRFLAAYEAADEVGNTPDASAITAATPCDEVLIQTLTGRTDLVDVNMAGYKSSGDPGAQPDLLSDVSELDYRFIERDGIPNWIEITSPAGATAELVASFALGSPAESYRLVASPPYFGLPMEVAFDLRVKKGLSVDYWALLMGASIAPWFDTSRKLLETERDPAFGLLRSGASDQAALNEANAGGQNAGGGDRGAILQILERTRNGLTACAQFAAPFSLDGNLEEPIAYVDGRLTSFESAPDDDVGKWFVQVEKQDDVVARAAMGLDAVERHLRTMGITDVSQIGNMPKAVRIPLERVANEFVDAAVLSRLVTTAEARVAKAEVDLKLAPLETIEIILKDIQTRVYALRSIDRKNYPNRTWSDYEEDELFETYMRTTPDDKMATDPPWEAPPMAPYSNGDAGSQTLMLQEEVMQLRGKMLAGASDLGPAIQELYTKVDKLSVETEIAMGYGFLGQAIGDVGKVGDDDWVMMAEGFRGDLFRSSDTQLEGEMYRITFDQAWGRYRLGDHEGARKILVDDLGKSEDFKTYLQRAYDTIDSMQTRAMILKIATLIGIVLVTMGFGSLAEGAALGAGAGEVGAFIVGATVEAGTFTALDAMLFGNKDVGGTLITEFATNLATFGLLRAWKLRKAAKVADEAMAVAKLENATKLEKMRGYLLKGKELTGEALVIAATGYAQMQIDSLRQRGQFVSLSEIRDMGKQGLAMVLGIAIGGRLFRHDLDELRRLGQQFGEDLVKRVDNLRDMSKMVETTKNADLALELVRQDRALLDKELELRQKRDDPDGTHPVTLDEAQAAHRALMAEAELTMALDEVVPGRVYMGTPDQVGPIVKRLEADGKKVKPVEENGRKRYEVEDGEKRYTINEAQHYSTRSGGEVVPSGTKIQTFEPNSVVGHVDSVTEGRDILRRLVAGDRRALADLGYDTFPSNLSTDKVEWGLARRWDGKLAVVLGGFADIDWSKLPHMKPLSHTHPWSDAVALKGTGSDGLVRIDDLADLSNDLTHLFPSAADISVMARGKIRDHVVHTPFIDRGGGRIGNPGPNETGKTVDFVIEKAEYVGRWGAAEDVGVYKATVTARSPDGTIWRGEIYAADAGGSMLFRKRPPIGNTRLPPPKPRFETQMGRVNAVLNGKLRRAGVPDPISDPSVGRVMDVLDSHGERWLEELLDLEQAGRVRGVKDWIVGAGLNSDPARIGNMTLEIREARRMVDEHPGEIIDVGADSRAQMKPGSTTEKDKSFDLEGSSGGAIARSVEVKSYGSPLTGADELGGTLDKTIEKITQRQEHSQPIQGELETRIDVHFFSGDKGINRRSKGYAYTHYDGTGNYQVRNKNTGDPILDAAGAPKGGNILDDMAGNLDKKPSTKDLKRVVLVDDSGVLAAYENASAPTGTSWTRTR